MKTLKVGFAAVVLVLAVQARADVKLPEVLSDHVVLQRGVPIHLWGWADPGEAVTVTLENDKASATADKIGVWSVKLPVRPAGGPYTITVAGKNTITLSDVLVGDVWVASGQSNMEIPMKGFNPQTQIKNASDEITKANYPQIRLLLIKKNASEYPLGDFKDAAAWQVCTPETVPAFSAVAYFFGREIYETEKVPIGLVDSTWGGTPAEAWVSLDGLSHSSEALEPVMQARAADMDAEEAGLLQRAVDAKDKAAGKTVPGRGADKTISWQPSGLYNAQIAPLTPMPIKGVIWYQGESNAGMERASHYESVFETLIEDWRTKWKQPDMPFLYVQIASYTSGAGWPIVQDQQRRTLELKNTGMAVANDVGEEHQIHPGDKQTVGHRLALNARAIAYGEDVVHTGPLFRSATVNGGSITVTFDSAAGLLAPNAPLGGFELAGADGVFSAAEATIVGDTVIVKSAAAPNPAFVRYAWASWPKGANLYNGAGLPTSAFTSQ